MTRALNEEGGPGPPVGLKKKNWRDTEKKLKVIKKGQKLSFQVSFFTKLTKNRQKNASLLA